MYATKCLEKSKIELLNLEYLIILFVEKILLCTTQDYIFKISRKTKIARRCKRGISPFVSLVVDVIAHWIFLIC